MLVRARRGRVAFQRAARDLNYDCRALYAAASASGGSSARTAQAPVVSPTALQTGMVS